MLSMNRLTIRNTRTIGIALSASLVTAVASSPALAMVTQDDIDRGMPESGSQIGHVNLGKPGRVILESEPGRSRSIMNRLAGVLAAFRPTRNSEGDQ